MATTNISTLFLRDLRHGGPPSQLHTVADRLASFVDAARTSIDLAIYDFRLDDATAVQRVVGSLTGAADRGVTVRIGYDAGKPVAATQATFTALEADPAPVGTAEWVTEHFGGSTVHTKAIQAGSQLMHCKYLIRDAGGDGSSAAVWTGSTNFTDDAWTRQENNIITLTSRALANGFTQHFNQMWTSASIKHAGAGDGGVTHVGGAEVGWDFAPGDGAEVNTALAGRIDAARQRVVVASMVLTSHEVLAALVAAIARDVPVSGIYDGGQMDPIEAQWRQSPHSADTLAHWRIVKPKLARKNSVPYTPTSVHNFMHLKVLISDDVVSTGSYNFSGNAEDNAENQIHLDDPTTVQAYADYIARVVTTYS